MAKILSELEKYEQELRELDSDIAPFSGPPRPAVPSVISAPPVASSSTQPPLLVPQVSVRPPPPRPSAVPPVPTSPISAATPWLLNPGGVTAPTNASSSSQFTYATSGVPFPPAQPSNVSSTSVASASYFPVPIHLQQQSSQYQPQPYVAYQPQAHQPAVVKTPQYTYQGVYQAPIAATDIFSLPQQQQPPLRKVSRTIENTREADETIAQPDDEELHAEDAADEFSAHFNHEITPQLLITSSRWCSTTTIKFIAELLRILPNAHYYKRGSYEIKQIVKYAKNRDFTAIIIVHDNRKEPNGLLVISLPEGPTAHFKISNIVLSKKIKGHGKPTSHLPELILNNFTTRAGHRVGRMLASLFPQQPNFRGRRVVTFHNQRDFIFFRHHRYIFEEKEVKDTTMKGKSKLKGTSKVSGTNGKKPYKDFVIARLQECGPRFTLKLLSLQHGTFDSKFGEYEWVHKADMDTSRRRFFM